MNAWLPQASYPCGNFSDTSSLKLLKTKGSIGHAFTVCIHTENQNQRSFYPFALHEISVLIELLLGHLCYLLTDVPPQPNSPPDYVFRVGDGRKCAARRARNNAAKGRGPIPRNKQNNVKSSGISSSSCLSHLFYTSQIISQSRTRVKLNRVFFPRRLFQARSLGCGFAR